MQNVAIVGTGLIGASFGLALRKAGFDGPIVGVSSPARARRRWRRGAIDRGAPLAEAVGQADLVYLSQTIGRILDTMRHWTRWSGRARWSPTPAAPSARSWTRRARSITPLPVSGRPSHGRQGNARRRRGRCGPVPRPHLGAHARRAGGTRNRRGRANSATGWSASARAWCVLDADEHDRVVALTSHLPQLGLHGPGRHRGRHAARAAVSAAPA